MNDYMRDKLIDRLEHGYDKRDRRDHRKTNRRDFEDFEDREQDERMGRRDRRDRRDFADGHGEMYLTKRDMAEWKSNLINEDGSHGPRFTLDDVEEVIKRMHIRFDEYNEKEFCMVMNMLYSDECLVNKKYISSDKELVYYAERAKAWLEDKDAPEGSEKLALYYYLIINND